MLHSLVQNKLFRTISIHLRTPHGPDKPRNCHTPSVGRTYGSSWPAGYVMANWLRHGQSQLPSLWCSDENGPLSVSFGGYVVISCSRDWRERARRTGHSFSSLTSSLHGAAGSFIGCLFRHSFSCLLRNHAVLSLQTSVGTKHVLTKKAYHKRPVTKQKKQHVHWTFSPLTNILLLSFVRAWCYRMLRQIRLVLHAHYC